jgi:hypothetical protein
LDAAACEAQYQCDAQTLPSALQETRTRFEHDKFATMLRPMHPLKNAAQYVFSSRLRPDDWQ